MSETFDLPGNFVIEAMPFNLGMAYALVYNRGMVLAACDAADLCQARALLRREYLRSMKSGYVHKTCSAELVAQTVSAAEPDKVKAKALLMIAYSCNDRLNTYKADAITAIENLISRFYREEETEAHAALLTETSTRLFNLRQTGEGPTITSNATGHRDLVLTSDCPIERWAMFKAWISGPARAPGV